MKPQTILTITSILLLFCSCSHLYEPALYHQDIAYMPKPASFDSVKTATYVSAGYNAYTNTHFNDVFQSGQINISRGHVFDNFNLAYGAFGVLGEYQNQDANKQEPNYFSNTFFGAYGARGSANFFINSGRTDFRIIGVEMAYSHEFGAYADKLKQLNALPGYFVDPRTDLFTIGLTTEVIFHGRNNPDIQHGFRGFLGTTPGHNNLDDTFYNNESPRSNIFRNATPRGSYFFKYKSYFAIVEASGYFQTIIFLRLGYQF